MVEAVQAGLILSAVLSTAAILVSAYAVIKIRRMGESFENVKRDQDRLMQIEEHVLEKDPDYEDFERTVSNLSEKLFTLVRRRYGLEATTYEEMIEELEMLEEEDEILEDLENFFRYLEQLEYTEGEIDEEDKALIRQAAFRLLRRAGPALEELEGHRLTE